MLQYRAQQSTCYTIVMFCEFYVPNKMFVHLLSRNTTFLNNCPTICLRQVGIYAPLTLQTDKLSQKVIIISYYQECTAMYSCYNIITDHIIRKTLKKWNAYNYIILYLLEALKYKEHLVASSTQTEAKLRKCLYQCCNIGDLLKLYIS